MKIKNLAFYGVMAAILGSVGTARADGATDSTIIASKGYVDAYAQKQADRVEGAWNDSATQAVRTSTEKYPSMNTLNDAITNVTNNQVQSNWNETNTSSPAFILNKPTIPVVEQTYDGTSANAQSGVAVASAIAGKEDTSNKLTAAADGNTVTPWSASTASDSQYPTVKAVAEQISAANPESVNTNALAQAEGNNSKLTQVAAIKDMVKISGRDNNQVNGNPDNNYRYNDLNAPDYASDQKVPSEKAVAVELGLKYNTAETTPVLDSGATNFETIVTNQSVGLNLGRLDALKENKSNKQAAQVLGANETATRWSTTEQNEASAAFTSDTKYPTVKAVAQQIAVSAVAPNPNGPISPSLTDHSIVTYNADGLVTGGIALPGLNDINAASGGSSGCDANNPCVLSYYVDNGIKYYKWTKMDIVDLDVVNDSNS